MITSRVFSDLAESESTGVRPALAKASQLRGGAILDALDDAVFVADRDGVTSYVNASARALSHDADLVGRPLASIVHIAEEGARAPHDAFATFERCAVRATETGTRVVLFGEDGTEQLVSVRWVVAPDAIVLFVRTAATRDKAQEPLVGDDRVAALGTLAAGVAHEINNPLTYLLLELEQMQRRLRALGAADQPAEQLPGELTSFAQSLGRAIDGADRVRRIVGGLTIFSRGDGEPRGLVDVRRVLESSVQIAWHSIRHRARLTKHLAEVPPVDAGEARLRHVFLSLLVNAAQAIPEGRADENLVTVATRTDDAGRVVIEIADSGIGIPADDLPRVFDPFFTTKGAHGSTGLGLAVVHGIVESMGGELEVTSREGQGSTFRVVLQPARPCLRVSSGSSRDVTARPRVLLIEDEPHVRTALMQALSADADVTVVAGAREGLALLRGDADFDRVLCDLMMPVMSGMDFYVELLRTVPEVAPRVVFMTGGAFTARAKAFLESVSNPCLEKPFDMKKLRSLIARR